MLKAWEKDLDFGELDGSSILGFRFILLFNYYLILHIKFKNNLFFLTLTPLYNIGFAGHLVALTYAIKIIFICY